MCVEDMGASVAGAAPLRGYNVISGLQIPHLDGILHDSRSVFIYRLP